MQPAGVAGTCSGVPRYRFPALTGWKPSTSFDGATAYVTFVSSMWDGSGSCTRIPSTSSSALSSSTSARTSASDVAASSRMSRASMPASFAAPCLSRM